MYQKQVTNDNNIYEQAGIGMDEEEDDGERYECPDCGKGFKPSSFEKHVKICKKVFQKKRAAFDMKNQRILDKEHAEILKNAERTEKVVKKGKEIKKSKTKVNWKAQSEQFRMAMRANSTVNENTTMGGNFSSKPTLNQKGNEAYEAYDDRTHCNLCNRKYNETAYDKHLPMCERKNKENAIKAKKGNPTGKR